MRPQRGAVVRGLWTASVLLLGGCAWWSGGVGETPTPQRPTFSSDTNTTAPDTLELEAGVVHDRGDLFDTPMTLKYGVQEGTEIFLSASPYQVVDQPGRDGRGPSDLGLGTRLRLVDETEDRPSFGAQFRAKLPTASESRGLSTGETDVFAAAILGRQIGRSSWTLFYEAGALGEVDDGGVDLQHGLALAGGVPLSDDLSAFGELAGVWVHEQDQESVFSTWGLAWAARPDLVVDTAFVVGLSDDAPDFQLVGGLTWNFGELRRFFGADSAPPEVARH